MSTPESNARITSPIALGVAFAVVSLAAAPALADQRTVTDPTGDTTMMRGGPDITSVTADYGNKRLKVRVTYATDGDLAYARGGGTITGANLKFRNGKSYVLQRHAADAGRQTSLVDEILVGDSAERLACGGVTSSVSAAKREVAVSAPVKCFKGKGTKLKAQGFSFTVNFDVDEAKSTKWIKQG